MSESLLLRPNEAADLLSLSRSRLYQMAQAGALPGVVHLGGSVRIHRPTLERWLTEQAAETKRGAASAMPAAPMRRVTPHDRPAA